MKFKTGDILVRGTPSESGMYGEIYVLIEDLSDKIDAIVIGVPSQNFDGKYSAELFEFHTSMRRVKTSKSTGVRKLSVKENLVIRKEWFYNLKIKRSVLIKFFQ